MASAVGRLFDRPLFIVSTPRSGSTLLFETLAHAPDLFTIGGESHHLIEGLAPFTPAAHGWHSNRLTASDAASPATAMLVRAFYTQLRNRHGQAAAGRVRMLEKTPKNALRIPFIDAIWPDARFIYLYRDPRQTIASMMRAWQSGKFRTYLNLPGWTGLPWSLVLVPGWQSVAGAELSRVVAHQWATATDILISDLAALPPDRTRAIDYDDLLRSPHAAITGLANSLDVGWDVRLGDALPPSRMTLTAPARDKWRELEGDIEAVWETLAPVDQRARDFLQALRPAA